MKNQTELKRQWTEEDGVIRFSVKSDGTTGKDWITRLEDECFGVCGYTKSLLESIDFKPTSGVTTEITVLKGELFSDKDRITTKIRSESEKIGLTTPNAEVACLIREKFTNEEIEDMGLWCIVVMHEPIKDSYDDDDHEDWGLLCASRSGFVGWLDVCSDHSGAILDRDRGFAFVASQDK